MSNGLDEGRGKLFSRVRFTDIPPDGVTGVRGSEEKPESCPDLGMGADPGPSPSFTRTPIAFWISPPTRCRTARFCLSSLNPISRSLARFDSRSAMFGSPTSVPNNFEGLFRLGGDGDRSRESGRAAAAAAAAASRFALDDKGNIDEADLKPNLLLPVLGGRGGGWSSELVLPVFCRVCVLIARSWYFCRMNLSIAESTSSASKGIAGLLFWGLYIRLDATFPTRFIF
jgi:hypothetical protein